MTTVTGEITREWIEKHGMPWPDPSDEVDGSEFVSVEELQIQPQWETLHYLQPCHPSRRVPTEFAYDEDTGEEWAIAWRDLTDEEWSEALAAHEKAMKEWRRTMGTIRQRTGPDIVTATFTTKLGAKARGRLARRGGIDFWFWTEVTWTTEDVGSIRRHAPSSRT